MGGGNKPVATLSDVDRTAFKNISSGVFEFDETEIGRLHDAAEEVCAVIKSALALQDKRTAASFGQMGPNR